MKCASTLLGSVFILLCTAPIFGDVVLFYDFNDASNAEIVKDITGNGNDGELVDTEYSGNSGGRTGLPGDRAMDFGEFNNDAWVDVVTATDGALDSVTENDQVTLLMWVYGNDEQPVDQYTFYAGPDRQLSSHIPWSDSHIYFDVAGTPDSQCCSDRINTTIALGTFSEEWNHYAFVKNEDKTAIYQNGELLLDGFDMRELNEITEFIIGAGNDGDRRSYSGLMDDFGVYDTALDEAEIRGIMDNGLTGFVVSCDLNADGICDAADIDLLTAAIRSEDMNSKFDLNGDGAVSIADKEQMVTVELSTYFGDSNLDNEFNSGDFVHIFIAAKYETQQAAGWADGDWDGDGFFDSSDFLLAFVDGGYELGPRIAAVPEPDSLLLMTLTLGFLGWFRRRS